VSSAILEEEAPFQNTEKSIKNKIMVMSPNTKNDCADKGQQQFARLDWKLVSESKVV
jgi:hypothetical protein